MFINMSFTGNVTTSGGDGGYLEEGAVTAFFNDTGNLTQPYRGFGGSRGFAQQPSAVSRALWALRDALDLYILPTALSLGLLANVLIILTFMATPLRRASLSHYFTAVAVADLAYILASLVVWISYHGLDLYNRIGGCQITTFTLLLSGFLATWFLLSAHVERCLVHFASGRTKRWCNIFRTKCVIIAIAIFSLVAFLYALWTHIVSLHRGVRQCFPMQESMIHIQNLRKVEIIFAGFIPMITMLAIDVVLLVKTLVITRCPGRNEPSAASSARLSTRLSHALERDIDLARERNRCTVVCVVIGVLFAVLQLPAFYFRARLAYASGSPLRRDLIPLVTVFEHVVKFNAVYKILVYVLILKSFRKALKHLFARCFKKRAPKPASDTSIESL